VYSCITRHNIIIYYRWHTRRVGTVIIFCYLRSVHLPSLNGIKSVSAASDSAADDSLLVTPTPPPSPPAPSPPTAPPSLLGLQPMMAVGRAHHPRFFLHRRPDRIRWPPSPKSTAGHGSCCSRAVAGKTEFPGAVLQTLHYYGSVVSRRVASTYINRRVVSTVCVGSAVQTTTRRIGIFGNGRGRQGVWQRERERVREREWEGARKIATPLWSYYYTRINCGIYYAIIRI